MFQQLGFGGKQATQMSTGVVKLAADLGSFNNLGTDDVMERLAAAFRGEYDSLQQLIPNINAARVEQEAMAMTGKKSATQLTAQEKAAATLAIVQKDGAASANDFSETSSGLANSQKILTSSVDNLKASIGEGLTPVLATVTQKAAGLTAWMTDNPKAFDALAITVGTLLAGAFLNWSASLVKANIELVKATASASVSAAKGTAHAAQVSAAWVANGARAVASATASAATTAAAWVAAGARAAASATATAAQTAAAWVAAGARAVASAAVVTASFVAQAAVMAATMAATAARVVAGWVLMGVQSMIQAARMAAAWFIALGPIGWIIAAVIGIVALIIANWDKIKAFTVQLWGQISEWLSGVWDSIKSGVETAWNGILDFFKNVGQWILDVFLNWTLAGLLIKHWDDIKNGVTTAWNAIVDWIRGIPQRFMDGLAYLGQLGAKFGEWVGGVWNSVTNGFNNVVNWIAGIPGRVVGALGDLGGKLWNAGSDIIAGFLNGLKAKFEAVKNFVSGIGSWIADHKGPKAYDLRLLTPHGGWIMSGLREGIEGDIPALEDTLGRVTSTIAGTAMPPLSVRAIGDAQVAGAGAGVTSTAGRAPVQITNYYPQAEPTSRTVDRAAQQLGLAGVL
jgi:phage-related protein